MNTSCYLSCNTTTNNFCGCESICKDLPVSQETFSSFQTPEVTNESELLFDELGMSITDQPVRVYLPKAWVKIRMLQCNARPLTIAMMICFTGNLHTYISVMVVIFLLVLNNRND